MNTLHFSSPLVHWRYALGLKHIYQNPVEIYIMLRKVAQIMDPKMDSGYLAPGETLDDDYDVLRDLLPEEVIGIMDQMLCYEVWILFSLAVALSLYYKLQRQSVLIILIPGIIRRWHGIWDIRLRNRCLHPSISIYYFGPSLERSKKLALIVVVVRSTTKVVVIIRSYCILSYEPFVLGLSKPVIWFMRLLALSTTMR